MGAEKLASELQAILIKRIQSEQLVVPTIPAVVMRAQEALRETDATVTRRATEVLEMDAFLAARALRLSATAKGGVPGRKATLGDTVTKLGPRGLKALLVEATAQKVFLSRDAEIANALRRIWEHSVAVATLARDVLALSGHADPEAAYLAGLLHDVGKPVVASILLEAERQTTELYNRSWIAAADWISVVNTIHRPVGLALADKWQLPEAIRACIEVVSDYDNNDRSSVVNAVLLRQRAVQEVGRLRGRGRPRRRRRPGDDRPLAHRRERRRAEDAGEGAEGPHHRIVRLETRRRARGPACPADCGLGRQVLARSDRCRASVRLQALQRCGEGRAPRHLHARVPALARTQARVRRREGSFLAHLGGGGLARCGGGLRRSPPVPPSVGDPPGTVTQGDCD